MNKLTKYWNSYSIWNLLHNLKYQSAWNKIEALALSKDSNKSDTFAIIKIA